MADTSGKTYMRYYTTGRTYDVSDGGYYTPVATYNESRLHDAVIWSRTSSRSINYPKKSGGLLGENPYVYVRTNESWPQSTGFKSAEPIYLGVRKMETQGYGWAYGEYLPEVGRHYSGSFTVAERAQLEAVAGNSLRLKVKDMKINLAQVYAERKQTARTVSDAATSIAKSLIQLRRGNFAAAAESLGVKASRKQLRKYGTSGFKRHVRANADNMSKAWLALQYGWKPILQDVHGAAEHLAQRPLKDHLNKVVARQQKVKNFQDGGVTPTWKDYISTSYEHHVTYGAWFTLGSTSEATALGLTNPALIAWELMPWSFVIDWFIPIGNAISSWDATVGVGFKQGYITRYWKRQHKGIRNYSRYGHVRDYVYNQVIQKWDRVNVERTPLGDFPSARAPYFKNPVSTTHVVSALALLNQLKSRS